MLHLVEPIGRLLWNELPASLAIPVAQEHGADLARLHWKPPDRLADDTTVRLALRHGIGCVTGIVIVDGVVISDMLGPVELATLYHESQASAERSRAAMPDDIVEQLVPGWKEHGRQLDQEIAASMAGSIAEAQDKLDELLAAAVDDALRRHWPSLHGVLPVPE